MDGFYEIPENYDDDLRVFATALADGSADKIDPVRFKAIRVGFGVYEQRTPDTYMVRIRCGGGAVTPGQLRQAAELSQQYGADHLHVTTRHELQMHYVAYENILAVVSGLGKAGLATKGDRIVIVGGSHLTAGPRNKQLAAGVHDIVIVHEVEGNVGCVS